MSSENQTPHQVSRRAVVGAAVWAVPVIAISTATPAFAAGSGTPAAGPTVIRIVTGLQVRWDNTAIDFNTLQLVYDAGGFTGVRYDLTPDTATVVWRIAVRNSSDVVVGTPIDTTSVLTRGEYKGFSGVKVEGLSKGTYTVVSEIISVVYTPNPHSGFNFSTAPSTSTQTVTIS